MPLKFKKISPPHNCKIAVWESSEDLQFFSEALSLGQLDKKKIASYKPHRQREWLTARYLLRLIVPTFELHQFKKNDFGKPYIEDSPQFISISHSRDHVAIVLCDNPVGIDIQHKEEKIKRIYNKFISTEECVRLDEDHLFKAYHIFWGAKEAMYKAYGKKSIDFRRDMHLFPFKCFSDQLELKGQLSKNDIILNFDIFTDLLDNFHLVYAIQNV